jgi:hypothetical protein
MSGSAYLHIIPGLVKVRLSGRGPRLYLGPRWARLHLGAGGTGVSTGAGEFTWYQPIKRGRAAAADERFLADLDAAGIGQQARARVARSRKATPPDSS